MDIKQIKEMLLGSLELKVTWARLLIVCLVVLPIVVFYGLTWEHLMEIYRLVTALALGIMVMPQLIFCVIRTVRIFRRPQSYILCRTTLARPHPGALRNTMYFTVVLEDPEDGSKFFVDTHAIFYSHGVMPPTIEEYTNSTVTIAYNRETEMVVVIG